MTSPSPTPDIASLSLSSQPHQRLHDTYDYDGSGSGNGRPQYQFSSSPSLQAQSQYSPLGMSQSPLKNKPLRGGLPSVRQIFSILLHHSFDLTPRVLQQQWLDNGGLFADSRSLSPPNNSDLSSGGGSPPLPPINAPPGLSGGQAADDEIIPTAIVIKNIPFNVKRETLLDIIVRK